MAETVDVHLYKLFSACRYIAQTASVKFRIVSPKTARNEQVCAHHVENCREYEIGVRGYSRSSKVVPFDRLCMVSY